jgi:ribonuclease HI
MELMAIYKALEELEIGPPIILYSDSMRIPTQSGHRFRFDAGRRTEMKPAAIPR